MNTVQLKMTDTIFRDIWSHLLPTPAQKEEACFALASVNKTKDSIVFQVVEWIPLEGGDFSCQYGDYLELSHEKRAEVIKKAHDMKMSLLEFHSHPFPYPAEFSFADLNGLQEFVPHVWWRLKERPYMAIVVSPSGYDALVWVDNPMVPARLDQIKTDFMRIKPTNITLEYGGLKNVGTV